MNSRDYLTQTSQLDPQCANDRIELLLKAAASTAHDGMEHLLKAAREAETIDLTKKSPFTNKRPASTCLGFTIKNGKIKYKVNDVENENPNTNQAPLKNSNYFFSQPTTPVTQEAKKARKILYSATNRKLSLR